MPPASYSPVQKGLHWTIFVLVVGLYAITYGEDLFPRGDPGRDLVWRLHISFGLLLLGLVVWRLSARLSRGAPSLPGDMSVTERRLAQGAHLLLYGLLVVLPMLGVLLAWFRGNPLSFFGLFTIPAPFATDRDAAGLVQELHEIGANLILIVAALHAVAALWHHFGRRDDVLRRMLPGRGA